jgi:hypothetical protein
MAWFVNSSGMKGAPEGVLKALDDIAEGENMDDRVKKDLMSNDEDRKVSCSRCYCSARLYA